MVKVEVVMDEKALHARYILNFKLVKLSWALFFILIGGSWTLENIRWIDSRQEWALIFAGSGGILLLLNVLRIIWKINISKFTIGLGVLGMFLGIARYYTLDVSIWSLLVLITGIFLLLEALRK